MTTFAVKWNQKKTRYTLLHNTFRKYSSKWTPQENAPEDILRGILNPITKPPEKKPKKTNTQPIITIITIAVIDPSWDWMKTHITPSWVVCQKNDKYRINVNNKVFIK